MKKIALIFWLTIISTSAFSQGEKFKATYLYQFAKILQWPNLGNTFTIGVWGESAITPVLKTIATAKKIGAKNLVIKKVSGVNDVSGCQILFLPTSSKNELAAALEKANGQHILIISDSPDSIKKGTGINFLVINGKVLYELSKSNMANQGLVSVQILEKLAHKVY